MSIQHITYKNSPAVRILTAQGSEVTVSLHGGTIISWKPVNADEQLFVSDLSKFSEGTAIRGGVPLCFPQFSTLGNLPQHGFARNKIWKFVDSQAHANSTTARFRLLADESTKAVWNHDFSLDLVINLENNRLNISLEVINTGSHALQFTTALHTYFRVKDINTVRILGLKGCHYNDRIAQLEQQIESNEALAITQEVDRVYFNTPSPLILKTPERNLTIHSKNLPDTITWNPWVDRSIAIADFPNDGFNHMVCIEAGAVAKPIELAPQATWTGSQIIELNLNKH